MTQETLLKFGTELLYLRDRVTNLENLLKEESENLKEFTLSDISDSLNNYLDNYIDEYMPRHFDSDELGSIDYDKDNNSINVYFDVDDNKIQEIIREQIESFIHNWYNIAQQERKSSTEEV